MAAPLFIFAITRFVLIDDAYITFRYVKNFTSAGELVFNHGERVEAITNLLWVLVLSPLSFLGLPLEFSAVAISLVLILFACVRLWQMSAVLGASPLSGAVAAVVLAANPDFVTTATNGLEAALYSALLIELVYRYGRDQFHLAFVAAGLLFMTRPEGVAFGLLLAGLIWWERKQLPIIGIAIFGVFVVGVSAFRLGYYGQIVPNSVIAKSVWSGFMRRGLRYVALFLLNNLPLAVSLLSATVVVLWQARCKGRSVVWLCLAGIMFSIVVAVRNGGDWMPGFRLLSQYAVLYAVLTIALLRQLERSTIIWALAAISLVAQPVVQTAYSALTRSSGLLASIVPVDEGMRFWRDTALRLRPVVTSDDVVSAEALGIIAYNLMATRFHDPLGLADSYIARHGTPFLRWGKRDAAYTLGVVRPSVLVWHWLGHLDDVSSDLLAPYEVFCRAECDGRDAKIVMIRRDCSARLAPAFADWTRVRLEPGHVHLMVLSN